jgi:hypothetical protein
MPRESLAKLSLCYGHPVIRIASLSFIVSDTEYWIARLNRAMTNGEVVQH